uniref:Secreted protein n=1 Tax=Steinernema glaseri TaxID=37863 RepID=A0A1I8AG70_9BILA
MRKHLNRTLRTQLCTHMALNLLTVQNMYKRWQRTVIRCAAAKLSQQSAGKKTVQTNGCTHLPRFSQGSVEHMDCSFLMESAPKNRYGTPKEFLS